MKISHQNKQEIYVKVIYLISFLPISVLCWNNNNEYWAVFFNLNFVVVSANVTVLLYCFFFFFFLKFFAFEPLVDDFSKVCTETCGTPKIGLGKDCILKHLD